jgi:hypothetical protein
MLPCTSYATSSTNVQCRIRCRTSKWQEPVKNVRYRTFFGDIVRCTYDVVQITYDVVYDIVYDIARTTGKNLYFDVRCRTSDVRYRIRYRIQYMHKQRVYRSHHNSLLSLQALFHPCHLKTAMTGIVHGIRMMKEIILTSSVHLLAQWHTTPVYRIPLPVFCPLFWTGVS